LVQEFPGNGVVLGVTLSEGVALGITLGVGVGVSVGVLLGLGVMVGVGAQAPLLVVAAPMGISEPALPTYFMTRPVAGSVNWKVLGEQRSVPLLLESLVHVSGRATTTSTPSVL